MASSLATFLAPPTSTKAWPDLITQQFLPPPDTLLCTHTDFAGIAAVLKLLHQGQPWDLSPYAGVRMSEQSLFCLKPGISQVVMSGFHVLLCSSYPCGRSLLKQWEFASRMFSQCNHCPLPPFVCFEQSKCELATCLEMLFCFHKIRFSS